MSQLQFAARVLMQYGSDKNCPFCQSENTELDQRKHLILHLRSCKDCGLRFRWPKETPDYSEKFYQKDYQEVSFTTELPDPATLRQFMANNFVDSPKDFSTQIAVLKEFLPTGRVLDFGCSWGYGTYQLRKAGYDAYGFEISRPRAELGRRELGVEILDSLDDLEKVPSASLDGIYVSHVLEHLLSLKEIFAFYARALKPGGVLFIMVPNGGGKAAREQGVGWSTLINEKHILALDRQFFEKNLAPYGFQVNTLSDPYDPPAIRSAIDSKTPLPAEGEELMVIALRSNSGA
jgi:SAM-dependent methyltransferase